MGWSQVFLPGRKAIQNAQLALDIHRNSCQNHGFFVSLFMLFMLSYPIWYPSCGQSVSLAPLNDLGVQKKGRSPEQVAATSHVSSFNPSVSTRHLQNFGLWKTSQSPSSKTEKKKKELQYLTSNYHMFPMGFWFHMGVSINGKTPSYYPFLDGDFPLQTIQLLGTPMTMETYQPLLITCFPICLYVYS
jgi:hypothetical protein